jgi:sec-independent protein translocase protein TatB
MFDVSLTELMVIGVVALIVIGPERLPRVARTAGHLLGRLQRYVNAVKSDINREMHIEDLRRFEQQVKNDVQSIESSVQQEMQSIDSSVESSLTETTPVTGGDAVPPAPTFDPAAAPHVATSATPATMDSKSANV